MRVSSTFLSARCADHADPDIIHCPTFWVDNLATNMSFLPRIKVQASCQTCNSGCWREEEGEGLLRNQHITPKKHLERQTILQWQTQTTFQHFKSTTHHGHHPFPMSTARAITPPPLNIIIKRLIVKSFSTCTYTRLSPILHLAREMSVPIRTPSRGCRIWVSYSSSMPPPVRWIRLVKSSIMPFS